MTREFIPRRPGRMIDRPVKPGSPLYRLLQMIAQAIAKDLEHQGQEGSDAAPMAKSTRRPLPLDPPPSGE